MKTIGYHLRYVRKVRKKTISQLSEETKIKKEFIRAIEREEWNKLPEFPVILGFVKNISDNLELNTPNVIALLRRDYPPQKLTINPSPELPREFRFGPRFVFLLGVVAIVLTVVSYLVFQYFQFTRPPALDIASPTENMIIRERFVEVRGKTEPSTTITVNDQPAFVDEEGYFYTEIEVSENLEYIEILARSRSGKETRATRTVQIE